MLAAYKLKCSEHGLKLNRIYQKSINKYFIVDNIVKMYRKVKNRHTKIDTELQEALISSSNLKRNMLKTSPEELTY